MGKIIVITGASSGIGRATAERLITDGHTVYGLARNVEAMREIEGLRPIKADMTDEVSLVTAVKTIIKQEGRIDVLFNNAGYGLYGAVEDVSIDDARRQFEVNLFGLARMTQLVVPHMRAAGAGRIINTSSMGGKIYFPLGAWYHASKHALEGWSDCLRLETAQFGIDVVIIEPGGIKTPWGNEVVDGIERVSDKSAYATFAQKVAASMRRNYGESSRLSPPSVIADTVARAIDACRPKTRYVAGSFAHTLIFARKYLGDRIFDRIITTFN